MALRRELVECLPDLGMRLAEVFGKRREFVAHCFSRLFAGFAHSLIRSFAHSPIRRLYWLRMSESANTRISESSRDGRHRPEAPPVMACGSFLAECEDDGKRFGLVRA